MSSAYRCFHCETVVAEGENHNCAQPLDPMKIMLLQLLFSSWLKLLNEKNYEELRLDIAKALSALKKDEVVSRDVYVCGCEVPTNTGQVRHFEMRCPNCQYPGGRSEGIGE